MRAAMAARGTARCPITCHRSHDPSAKQRSAELSEGAHRRYGESSAERFARQARDIGPDTEALILAVLARRPHPEQGFRTCVGVLRLFRGLDAARAEAVSRRAIEVGVLTYASVASILKHRLDQSAPPQAADGAPLLHENIRGSGYFH